MPLRRALSIPSCLAAAVSLLVLLHPAQARAEDMKVLAAGAIAPIVRAAAADFEQRSGIHVIVENATAGVLERNIRSGRPFDVTVLPSGVLSALARDSMVERASARDIARVGIAVAVRQGAPVPAIGSVEQFRQALLAAPSVALIDPKGGGSSGIYLEKLFDRLGIGAQIRAKQVLVPGGLVAEKLVDGSAALALHQQSEILLVKGAHLVGPLPAALQNYTVYAGAVGAHARSPVAGKALLSLLNAARAREDMRAHGLEPVGD